MKSVVRMMLVFLLASYGAAMANPKITFWDSQRKGANGGGGKDAERWFAAAEGFGIEYVRLSPATWKAAGRDFLIGDADNFTGIPQADLKKLKSVLDTAERHGVKIVLTMFSLPGVRWRQHNDYKFDYRLWNEERYQQQAMEFWKELAAALKDHPAVVAYNPLNEPHPARQHGFESGTKEFVAWLEENKGKTADLNRFNRRIVEAIRQADPDTPIMLDCWFHASPEGFKFLDPVTDKAVLYSFHFYDPWNFTTWRVNKERFSYPDTMPMGWSGKTERWTPQNLRDLTQPVVDWARQHQIDARHIAAVEFGCDRRVAGAQQYLSDLVSALNDNNWHWAFYAFRSPDWDGLDYELGTEKLGWKYWQAREEGKDHEHLIDRHDNPLWNVLKRQFK
jgi:hypothetical protein